MTDLVITGTAASIRCGRDGFGRGPARERALHAIGALAACARATIPRNAI